MFFHTQKWALFFLGFLSAFTSYADEWNISVASDNYIEINNFWNFETVEIELQVSSINSSKVFVGKLKIAGNHKEGLSFPNDFKLIENQKNDSLLYDEYRVTALVKKNKIASTTFFYLPPKKSELQLIPYLKLTQEYEKLGIWGQIIDGYSWYDKLGQNLVVRSFVYNKDTMKLPFDQKTYLYCYQFNRINEWENWTLIKKITDISKGCERGKNSLLNISNPEITDFNQDSIGEFASHYILNCNSSDSLLSSRYLLITNGEKYIATSTYSKKERKQKIVVDFTQPDEILQRHLKFVLLNESYNE